MKKIAIIGLFVFIFLGLLTSIAVVAAYLYLNYYNVPDLSVNNPIKITGDLSKKEVDIGEPFQYKVKLYQLANVDTRLDDIKPGQLKALKLNDVKTKTILLKPRNIKIIEKTYTLQPVDMTIAIIPEIKATSGNFTKILPPVKITPKSVLPKIVPMKKLNDIKPLEKYLVFKLWYLLIPVGIIALGFLIWFLSKRIKFKPGAARVDPELLKSPYELAYEGIERLRRMRLETPDDFKIFYTELSEIFRKYIESTFKIAAIEKTSEEINAELYNISINLNLRTIAKSVLRDSDMVKFAKYIPPKEYAFASLEKTAQFIDGTTIHPEAISVEGGKVNV